MSKDEYYADKDARLNTLMADDRQAKMLKKAWEQWSDCNSVISKGEHAIEEFRSWLLSNYGIRLTRNHLGYQLPFMVEDEQKYAVFLLKFT